MSAAYFFALAKVRINREYLSCYFIHSGRRSCLAMARPSTRCRGFFYAHTLTDYRSLFCSMVASRGKWARFTCPATIKPLRGPKITVQLFRLVTVGKDTSLRVNDGANAISPSFSSCPSCIVSWAFEETRIETEAPFCSCAEL